MADARTSGTAVTRIFSVLEVNGRDEEKAFAFLKKMRPSVQLYTKSGGGGTLAGRPRPGGGGIFFIVDALDTKAKGYDVRSASRRKGSAPRRKASRCSRARRTPPRARS